MSIDELENGDQSDVVRICFNLLPHTERLKSANQLTQVVATMAQVSVNLHIIKISLDRSAKP
jgi:hypothetical protein